MRGAESPFRRPTRPLTAFVLALAALLGAVPVAGSPLVGAQGEGVATTALVPVRPCRLLDTRDSIDRPGERLAAGTSASVTVAGRCDVGDEAVAAALTVTVVGPQTDGYAVLYPGGEVPATSTVNYRAGEVVANMQLTRLEDGSVQAYTMAAAHLVVDVTGYFRATDGDDDGTGRFVAVPPERVHDTRAGARPPAGATVRVDTGVPDDAVAVAVNVTTAETVGADVFTVYAAGSRRPNASSLNVDRAGQSRAASAVVPVTDGAIDVYTAFGNHVIVDLLGYFTGPHDAASDTGLFVAVDPFRLVDTRAPRGDAGGPRLWAGGGREWAVPAEPLGVSAARVGALALNATMTSTEDAGFVTFSAAGVEATGSSSLNASSAQQTVANAAIVTVSERGLQAAAYEATHLVVDVTGWFVGEPVAANEPPLPNTPPPDRKVTIITDSALAGIRWNGALDGLQGFAADDRMESCRRLVLASCRGREGYRPRSAVSEIATLTDVGPDDIVVIATGYDDWWQRFSSDFDAVVAAARAQGFHHIVWVTYRSHVSYNGLGQYYAVMNGILREKAASGAFPDVRIWDYETYTASAAGWFSRDGIHLTTIGAYGSADWLSRHVRAFDDRPCPQPWAPGQAIEDPCPDPDPLAAARGLPDIAGLYG